MSEDIDLIPLYGKPDNTAPLELSVSQNDPTSIRLNWSAPTDASFLSGYGVYYSFTDTFAYNKIGETTGLEYTVTGLEHGREYLFAVNSILYDESTFFPGGAFLFGSGLLGETPIGVEPSSISGIIFPLNSAFIPQNPRVSGFNQNSILLEWDPPVSGHVSGYRIWRSNLYSDQMDPIGSTKNTQYTDSGLDVTSYYYRVTSLY